MYGPFKPNCFQNTSTILPLVFLGLLTGNPYLPIHTAPSNHKSSLCFVDLFLGLQQNRINSMHSLLCFLSAFTGVTCNYECHHQCHY